MPTLDELRAFLAVCECGGFGRAAQRLELTTNAVSLRVGKLEAALGVRLFTRTTRRVTTTDEGRRYYPRVHAALGELDAAGDDIRPGDGLGGTVRLGIPGPVATRPFLRRLHGLLAAHPGLAVQLRIANGPLDVVAEGLDAALVVGRSPSASLVARPLARIGWVLAASPSYLAARGRPRHPDELARHDCLRFLQRPSQDHWTLIDPRGRRVRVPVGGNFEADDSRALGDAAYAGLGIGLRPAGEVARASATGELERVLPRYQFEPLDVLAVLPKGRLRLARVAACVRALQGAVDELG